MFGGVFDHPVLGDLVPVRIVASAGLDRLSEEGQRAGDLGFGAGDEAVQVLFSFIGKQFFRWDVEVGIAVARAGIVEVDEEVEHAFGVGLPDGVLRGADFGPVRIIAPVAIVIPGFLALAAGSHFHAVHIHDRHEGNVDLAAERRGAGIVR